MASFLEGQLRNAIAKGFKGKLRVGTLTRMIPGGLDEYGDIIPATPQNFRVEGFVDTYSDFYRAQAGIPQNDVKIVLIAGNSATEPKKEDEISFAGYPTYQVREIKTDPAFATWELQSFSVE